MMDPSETVSSDRRGPGPVVRSGMVWLVVFPAVFMLVVFFLIPMFVALRYSLLSTMPFFDPETSYTLANYIHVLTEPIYLRSFVRTAGYAVTASAISLLISYPVAYYLACKARRGALILLVMLIPFWTSIILRVFSWKIILGSSGIINSLLRAMGLIDLPVQLLYNRTGIIFGLVYTYTPFMILPLYATLGKVPRELLEASEDLGYNKLQTLWRITLPLTRSGTMSAVILVLLACFGDVLSAQMLGGANTLMISSVIFETFMGGANWNTGSALSVIVFGALLLLATVLTWLGREVEHA
ncbi:MAG: ABC transporter permease [Deltaproteobacteria bacterium]|nr:MAG: ABC transporter permease [Deltaproteobacteria bacterium]